MHIELLSRENQYDYKNYVEQHPNANIYHTIEWKRVLEDTYRYRPYYLLLRDNSSVKAVLPLFYIDTWLGGRRLVSLPFSHYVPILYDNNESLSFLVDYVVSLSKRLQCHFVQLRCGDISLAECFMPIQTHYRSELSLAGRSIDDIWRRRNMNQVRQCVKRARRKDILVKEVTELKDYRHFYMLELKTRHFQGMPCYPQMLFDNIYYHLCLNRLCNLFLAYYEGYALAGLIILCYNKNAIYAYGGSLKDKEVLSKRPNEALFWHAIEFTKAQDINMFDFGSTPLSNKGLLQFKKKWGTETEDLFYLYFSKDNRARGINREGTASKVASRALRLMPEKLFELVGSKLIRQVG